MNEKRIFIRNWLTGPFLISFLSCLFFVCPVASQVPAQNLAKDSAASSQKTKDGLETKYGMGWFIGKAKSGQRIYEHSGGSFAIFPEAMMGGKAKRSSHSVRRFQNK